MYPTIIMLFITILGAVNTVLFVNLIVGWVCNFIQKKQTCETADEPECEATTTKTKKETFTHTEIIPEVIHKFVLPKGTIMRMTNTYIVNENPDEWVAYTFLITSGDNKIEFNKENAKTKKTRPMTIDPYVTPDDSNPVIERYNEFMNVQRFLEKFDCEMIVSFYDSVYDYDLVSPQYWNMMYCTFYFPEINEIIQIEDIFTISKNDFIRMNVNQTEYVFYKGDITNTSQ